MARKPNAAPPVLDANGDPEVDLVVVADGADAEVNGADIKLADADESEQSVAEQLRAATARAEKAEREAAEARQQIERQHGNLQDTRLQLIERAMEATNAEKAELRRQIIEAKQSGNYESEVELTDKLQQINTKLDRLNNGKVELEVMAEAEKDLPTDPVERYVANMTPRAADWVRGHKELVTDPVKNRRLVTAHFKALGEELEPGSDEYFQSLEAQLGYGDPPQRNEPPARRETPRPPAAPVSRSGVGGGDRLPDGVTRRSDGSYRMSPQMLEYAKISGVSPQVYLKQVLEMHKNGEMLN